MLRRTKGLNAAYLPPLASYVVFCRLSELQVIAPPWHRSALLEHTCSP